ncbi:CRP-like cAMP-binding protein [Arcicella aurantiaca]|uniref:CRP-like cAMP-binding protein n=1 Tax=Arcicella aurantiaca TaxID=591202 RepID=A0A316E6Z4_9BACT|nr:Crp/Fnr family transcriptional regulator [Arcicella aurantiaca]PWK26487.1 CRP-like cAMP-binding protein [Arcicella aurantiaca]
MKKTNHTTPEEAASFLEFANNLHPLTRGISQYLIENTYPKSVKKGKILHKAGEICTTMYFVKKGVLRGFVNDENREITTWITADGELVSAICSFILQIPTHENIQTLEDCELVALSQPDLERLYLKHPSFNITVRKLIEIYYMHAEHRAYIVRLKKAEQKYQLFLKHYGHLANRVPVKHIASFLGITLETLSRLRAKK